MKSFGKDFHADERGARYAHDRGSKPAVASTPGLVSSMTTFGRVLKNANLSLEETVGFFGSMETAGVDITRVMPALNMSLRRAATEGVQDLRGHLGGLIESIRNAETGADALSIATTAFGAEGAQRMTSAIRTGALPALDELVTMYGDSTGALESTYEAGRQWRDVLREQKDALLAQIGPYGDVLGAVGSMVAGLGTFFIAFPAGAGLVSKAAAAMWTAITGPVGLVIAALVAVGVAVYVFRDDIKEAFGIAAEAAEDWSIRTGDALVDASPKFLEATQVAIDATDEWIELLGKANKAEAAIPGKLSPFYTAMKNKAVALREGADAALLSAQALGAEAEAVRKSIVVDRESARVKREATEAAIEAAAAADKAKTAISALTPEVARLWAGVADIKEELLEIDWGKTSDGSEQLKSDLVRLGVETKRTADETVSMTLVLAGLAGEMGGAAGQSLSFALAMRESNAALARGEESALGVTKQFSDARIGSAVLGGGLSALSGEFDGLAGEALQSGANIANAYAQGGPVMAAIAGVIEGVKWLAKGFKALFGVSEAEKAGARSGARVYRRPQRVDEHGPDRRSSLGWDRLRRSPDHAQGWFYSDGARGRFRGSESLWTGETACGSPSKGA